MLSCQPGCKLAAPSGQFAEKRARSMRIARSSLFRSRVGRSEAMGCGSTKAPQVAVAVTPPKAVVRPRRIGSAKTQVAVVLPGSYNKLLLEPLGKQTTILGSLTSPHVGFLATNSRNDQYSYHVLATRCHECFLSQSKDQETFSLGLPLSFDADSFVESAIDYCKRHQIQVRPAIDV